jgi:O-methyltransferase involved in polyketide biosynthesis
MADEIVNKLDYDCARFHLSASPIINIAHRAKKLDEVARTFITRHPNAVALDLGAGLDTRMFRIAPPSTVDWYDIDFPEVITARRQLLPDRANAHGVGTDLTDATWLDAMPSDRPAVIVADGLLAFLTQDDMISLLNRLISHFPSGEVAFNGYTRFAIWAAKHYHGTQSVADLIRSPGFDDPREPERWNPRLKLVKEILLTREPEVAEFPLALRLVTRLAAHSAAWSRRGTTVLHYRF